MTYASYISSGLRQAAQTRESRVLFHYEKRREAMEKPGEHAEQTHSLDPAYMRQHTYYQALQHHYQSMMHHRQTLMAHHESLMEHQYMVQALYEEVLNSERGTPNQQGVTILSGAKHTLSDKAASEDTLSLSVCLW